MTSTLYFPSIANVHPSIVDTTVYIPASCKATMNGPNSIASRTLYNYFNMLKIMLNVATVSGVVMSVLDISTVPTVLNINVSSVYTSVVDVITLQSTASYTSMSMIDGPPSFWKGIFKYATVTPTSKVLELSGTNTFISLNFIIPPGRGLSSSEINVDTFYHELNISILQISLCQDESDT